MKAFLRQPYSNLQNQSTTSTVVKGKTSINSLIKEINESYKTPLQGTSFQSANKLIRKIIYLTIKISQAQIDRNKLTKILVGTLYNNLVLMSKLICIDGMNSKIVMYALSVIKIINSNFQQVKNYLAAVVESNQNSIYNFLQRQYNQLQIIQKLNFITPQSQLIQLCIMNICKFYGLINKTNSHEFYGYYLSMPFHKNTVNVYYQAFEGYCHSLIYHNLQSKFNLNQSMITLIKQYNESIPSYLFCDAALKYLHTLEIGKLQYLEIQISQIFKSLINLAEKMEQKIKNFSILTSNLYKLLIKPQFIKILYQIVDKQFWKEYVNKSFNSFLKRSQAIKYIASIYLYLYNHKIINNQISTQISDSLRVTLPYIKIQDFLLLILQQLIAIIQNNKNDIILNIFDYQNSQKLKSIQKQQLLNYYNYIQIQQIIVSNNQFINLTKSTFNCCSSINFYMFVVTKAILFSKQILTKKQFRKSIAIIIESFSERIKNVGSKANSLEQQIKLISQHNYIFNLILQFCQLLIRMFYSRVNFQFTIFD